MPIERRLNADCTLVMRPTSALRVLTCLPHDPRKHMKKRLTPTLLFVAAILSAPLFAQSPVGKIDSLQMPAWLDRGGRTVPASPGIELFPRDGLRTGKGARLLIALNEGSIVRLGENASFEVNEAERKGGIFTAALSVVEGAFRFSTRVLSTPQPRNITISVARNATIGIRGTDLWGRSRDDKDIVCLIEGKIDVTGNNNKTLRLDQPLQFFQSTRNAPPEPVSFLDPKQLEIWAKETDLEAGKGSTENGQWKIVIGSFASRDALLVASRSLRDAGYGVDRAANNTLVLGKLASQAQATELAAMLQEGFGLADVKAGR